MLLTEAMSPTAQRRATSPREFPMFPPIAATWARSRKCPWPITRFLVCNRKYTRGIFRGICAKHVNRRGARRRDSGFAAAGIDSAAGKLSGGNLQKLILGREIMRGSAALIVEHPTRGLDVGAVEAVWKELLTRAAGRQSDFADLGGTGRASEPRRSNRGDV